MNSTADIYTNLRGMEGVRGAVVWRLGDAPVGDLGGLQVRALHRVAVIEQHFGDVGHADATDPDEVDAAQRLHLSNPRGRLP